MSHSRSSSLSHPGTGGCSTQGKGQRGGSSVYMQLQVAVLLTDLWQAEDGALGLSLLALSPVLWACAVTSASAHGLASGTAPLRALS